MDMSPKRKQSRKIKLPNYSNRDEYEPQLTARQELDAFWDGETVPSDDKKEIP